MEIQINVRKEYANVGITMPAKQQVIIVPMENVNVDHPLLAVEEKNVLAEFAKMLVMILFVPQMPIIA